MPRSTREYIKRYNDQMINDLERILGNINRLLEIYSQGDYPHTAFYIAYGESIEEMKNILTEFKENNV